MAKAGVYNQTGEKVAETELNPKFFGLTNPDAHLIHFAVRVSRNNRRKAIAHTKNRGEVSGSGKKPWRQKGTGRARAGSIRSPLWRGGGITFGPTRERNFGLKLNRRMFRQALLMILSDKVATHKLAVLDRLEGLTKTRELAKLLAAIAAKARLGRKYVLILPGSNPAVEQAGRNLSDVKVLVADQLNVFDLLKYDPIIMQAALPVIERTYGNFE